MAWILTPDNKKIEVFPRNGVTFSPREIMDFIKSFDYVCEHIMTHTKQFSGYKIAYDPAKVNNINQFNIEATKAVIKGRFSESEHTLLGIQMRLNKHTFVSKNPDILYVGGFALAGNYTEFKGH